MRLNRASLGRKTAPVGVILVAAALFLLSLAFFLLMLATSGDMSDVFMFIALAGFAFTIVVFGFGMVWLIWESIKR